MSLTIKYDFTELKKLTKTLNTIQQHHIEYGFVEGQTYPLYDDTRGGMFVAWLAFKLEYGLADENLPPRPFFTQSLGMGAKVAREGCVQVFSSALHGRYTKKALSDLAHELATTVKASINTQTFAPLKPRTIANKGTPFILVESGFLYNSITGKVRKGKVV